MRTLLETNMQQTLNDLNRKMLKTASGHLKIVCFGSVVFNLFGGGEPQ